MKLFSLIFILFLPLLSFAASNCFIVSDEQGKTIHEEGDCTIRYTPASSFKIPLALMGFDSGIFKNPSDPVWKYKAEYNASLKIHQQDLNPQTWMNVSAVWYSQILTRKLGMKKFQSYIDEFNYGNKDLSGGLTEAWLGTSLKISPQEQVIFIKNFIDKKWPLSENAYRYTKEIINKGILHDQWELYGKTGSMTPLGWFVGWIEKNNKTYIFAYLRTDEDINAEPIARMEARVENAKVKLIEFINKKA
ncbi:MAG: penicillin-binding transpeptidase domain-containing protein [Legionellales bacterium]